jgi:hypothetical protein
LIASALLIAAAAAYPAPAQAALFIDDASGLKAFLDRAGVYARSMTSAEVSRQLRAQVGADPLSQKGTLVFSQRSTGFVTAMSAADARRLLKEWRRPTRIGTYAKGKLYTASGPEAKALLKALQRPRALKIEPAPLSLWVAVAPPLKTATAAIDASADGLVVHGIVTASKPILEGQGPPPCDPAAMGCLRIALGPAAREAILDSPVPHDVMVEAIRDRIRAPLQQASRFWARLDALDATVLTNERSIPRALRYAVSYDDPPSDGPQFEARLDLARVGQSLAKLTPLDAFYGETAAMAYAGHLIYGRLLLALGPLVATANAEGNAAQFELRLPLH